MIRVNSRTSLHRALSEFVLARGFLKVRRSFIQFLQLLILSLSFSSSAFAFALAKEVRLPHAAQIQQNILISQNGDATAGLAQDQGFDFFSYNFGWVFVHSRHYVRYDVTNTGDTNLTFLKATISGPDFDAFHNCTKGLAIGEKCWFEIQYSPLLAGTHMGRFTLSFREDRGIVVNVQGHAREF